MVMTLQIYSMHYRIALTFAKKVAFFVGLTENFGPVTEHTDIIFDRVITNIGGGYEPKTGRFTSPHAGVYQFNVIVSAQGRQKVDSPLSLISFMLCTFTHEPAELVSFSATPKVGLCVAVYFCFKATFRCRHTSSNY